MRLEKNTLRRNADKGQADPVRDLSQDMTQEGMIGPKEVVHTSAVYMEFAKKKVVMTTQLRTWLIKSSHCSIIKFECQLNH